jgi:cytoplasmic iron level regulating protein YaaA (DUF328/UPF0246 family)
VLILLPPSEGKTAPRRGAPVDLSALVHPELEERRAALLDDLIALSAGPTGPALAALGLSAGQAEELERNRGLRAAPAARAGTVYTGVLYERLGLPDLPAAARRRAQARVLIASALWGVVRPGDRIPAYRLSIGARLPVAAGKGLAAWWRPALTAALPDDGLIVDLRSGSYAAAWKPRAAATVAVRAFAEQPAGERTVISHMAKAVRGEVARLLLTAGRAPRSPEGVAEIVAAAGRRVELAEGRGGWTLDVIEPAA